MKPSRTPGLLGIAAAVALLAPAAAGAATISSDGTRVTYSAAPGEVQQLELDMAEDGGQQYVEIKDFGTNPIQNLTPGLCEAEEGYARCLATAATTVNLGDGDDYALGGPTSDQIDGGGGNDRIEGGAGNDSLNGGAGDDSLEGTDALGYPKNRAGADALNGGPGTDLVSYFAEYEAVALSIDGAANDGVSGEGDNIAADVEAIRGGYGNDRLTGDAGSNRMYGDIGDDELHGGDGNDRIEGGRDQDRSYGEGGDDEIFSGHGDDFLDGGAGADRMDSDGGDYACGFIDCADRAVDTIEARDGIRDTIGCGIYTDTVTADPVDDVAASCERVDRGGGGGSTGPLPGTGGPLPGTDAVGPELAAALSGKPRLRKVLARGLPVAVSCDEACSLSGVAKVSGRDARGLKVVPAATKTVAKGKRRLAAAGQTKLVLKFTKKARKKLARKRRVKMTVTIAAKDAGGNASTVRRKFTITR